MTDLRKAAEMALGALENSTDFVPVKTGLERETNNAIQALRQALAEPEQEPVAWMHNFIEGNVIAHKPADISRHPDRWTALYTAPPKKEWVGLTDEEVDALLGKLSLGAVDEDVRTIEAKLKEKNT